MTATKDTIRDSRPPFLMIEEDILSCDLSPYELTVYVWLIKYVNRHSQTAFPSYTTLAKKTKMSRPKVIEAMKSLSDKGLVSIEKRTTPDGNHKSNLYAILPVNGRGVVNDVYQGSQSGLPGVVNDVYPNHIESNHIELTRDSSIVANAPIDSPPSPTVTNAAKPATVESVQEALDSSKPDPIVQAKTPEDKTPPPPDTAPPPSPSNREPSVEQQIIEAIAGELAQDLYKRPLSELSKATSKSVFGRAGALWGAELKPLHELEPIALDNFKEFCAKRRKEGVIFPTSKGLLSMRYQQYRTTGEIPAPPKDDKPAPDRVRTIDVFQGVEVLKRELNRETGETLLTVRMEDGTTTQITRRELERQQRARQRTTA